MDQMSQETVNEQEQRESAKDYGDRQPEEVQQSQKDLPDFPEEAWVDLFQRYRDLHRTSTEATDSFHWAVFVTFVGLRLGRNVYVKNPLPLYPNFYSALIGPTGLSRKTTAERLGESLVSDIKGEIEILHGVVSSEGIYQRLGGREGTRLLITADEFKALLQVSKRQATSDIIPKLCTLYNCPEVDSVDRRKDPITITRPFVSLITGSPLGWLEGAFGRGEVLGGFLNRFLFLAGSGKAPLAFPEPPDSVKWDAFMKELIGAIKVWEANPRAMEWSEEARELYKNFYDSWHERQKTLPDEISALTNRIPDHIVKIAMVYSALTTSEEITAEAIAIAIAVGRYLEEITLTLFGDVALSEKGRVEQMIITRLRSKGGMMEFRGLRQSLGSKVETNDFNMVMSNLEKAEVIKIVNPGALPGLSKKAVGQTGQQTPKNSDRPVNPIG